MLLYMGGRWEIVRERDTCIPDLPQAGKQTFNKRELEFECCGVVLKVLVATIDAQWEGMGDVGSTRYESALLPLCPTIRVISCSN